MIIKINTETDSFELSENVDTPEMIKIVKNELNKIIRKLRISEKTLKNDNNKE